MHLAQSNVTDLWKAVARFPGPFDVVIRSPRGHSRRRREVIMQKKTSKNNKKKDLQTGHRSGEKHMFRVVLFLFLLSLCSAAIGPCPPIGVTNSIRIGTTVYFCQPGGGSVTVPGPGGVRCACSNSFVCYVCDTVTTDTISSASQTSTVAATTLATTSTASAATSTTAAGTTLAASTTFSATTTLSAASIAASTTTLAAGTTTFAAANGGTPNGTDPQAGATSPSCHLIEFSIW